MELIASWSLFLIHLAYCSKNNGVTTPAITNSTLTLNIWKSRCYEEIGNCSVKEIKCDRIFCQCDGDKAQCRGEIRTRLCQYIPQMPAHIRLFRMWKASYPKLTRNMMSNISNFNILTFDLANNRIAHIENETFFDFSHLESLTLSGNPISALNLKASFWSLCRSPLQHLILELMNISSIPENFFGAFSNMSLSRISLKQNRLALYDNSDFAMFSRVEYLDVSQNAIDRLILPVRANILKLRLDANNLDKIPDFCLSTAGALRVQDGGKKEETSAYFKLQSLYLAQNRFTNISRNGLRGGCLPDLLKLDISGSTLLTRLEDNFVADLPRLESLEMRDMHELAVYEQFAFNSSSLVSLTLRKNRKIDRKSANLNHMFSHCPKLKKLDIIETPISLDIHDEVHRLLLPLQSAEEITLDANSLGFLPEDTLWRLPKLKKLTFTNNRIIARDLGRALTNVTHIEVLNLRGNGIPVLDEAALPWEFRSTVKEIDLSHNFFSCTCELLWFRGWLEDIFKNKSIIMKGYPSNQYRCRTPASMRDVPLRNYLPTAELCAVKNPYVLIGVLGGCALSLFVITGALTYRYRWHLRFYVYRLRRRRRYIQAKRQRFLGEDEMIPLVMYDLYVAHCTEDTPWIMEELLPLLEGVHGLRVFLEERDSKAGGRRDYNVISNMDKSARVMLVLSNNFMTKNENNGRNEYEWRQFELKEVLTVAIEEDKDVIVLLLGDITPANMTKEVRSLLTRGSYLQWSPGDKTQNKLFRDGLRVALRTQCDLRSMC